MASTATTEGLPPEVELEESDCPNGCPRADEDVLVGRDRLHNLPGSFAVVRCKTCRLMRTNPRPTPSSIGYYYPADYSPYLDSIPGKLKPRKKDAWHRRLRKKLQRAIGTQDARDLPLSPPGRLLEIGCASGAYLARAAAEGWTVSGIEFSEQAAQRARDAGFQAIGAAIEDVPAPAEKYNVIAGWMVFEHLHRPEQTLRRIREWIRDDGRLVMSVPDAGALEFRLFGPRWYALHLPGHMTHFTSRTLPPLLRDCGWDVEKIFWQRNPNYFLQSLRYWALDTGRDRLAKLMLAMIKRKRLRWLHRLMGTLMAITHQSGRMVIWARPRSTP